MAKDRNSSPLFILVAIVTAVAAMYFAKAILLPLALAILLSYLLTPLTNRLERWHVPRVPAVIIVVVISFAFLGGLASVVTNQLVDLSRQLPAQRENLIAKIKTIRPSSHVIAKVSETLSDLKNELTTGGKPKNDQKNDKGDTNSSAKSDRQPQGKDLASKRDSAKSASSDDNSITSLNLPDAIPKDAEKEKAIPVRVVEMPPSPLEQIKNWLGPLVTPLTHFGIVIVLVVFLLIDRENQANRLILLFGRSHRRETQQAIHDVAWRVGRYLRALFVVNAGYGVAIATGLALIGVPGALMWGVLGFSLRFLPYVGPWIAASMPILVSISTSSGWTQPLLVFGWYITVELIVYNVIEPFLYGSSTGVSTVGVILSAIFWTWLWGPVGLILAMPMTVCLVVASHYVPQLRFIGILLAEPPPTPSRRREAVSEPKSRVLHARPR